MLARDREVALLARALDEACAGHGQLILVAGEAGSGKTRFVQEVAEVAARRGVRVIRTASPLDAVGHALAQATPAAPTLVVLDDPGALDETLLASLVAAAPRLAVLPAVVLVTMREPRPGAVVPPIATPAGGLQRLAMAPLSNGAVAGLVDASGLDVPARTLQRLRAVTGGNALLVVESLAALARVGTVGEDDPWPLSDRAVEWMRGRLEALPAASRVAVEVASILGEVSAVATIARVLGDGTVPSRVGRALDESLIANVCDGEGRCRFRPALLRDLVQASLAAARRAELHERVAAALEDDDQGALVHRTLAAVATGDVRRAEVHLRRLVARAVSPGPLEGSASPYGVPHLACEGLYWAVGFGARSVRLPARAGLVYLAYLLARPGVEVAALQLVDTVRTERAAIDPTNDRGSAAERARVSVTRRIRDAIDRIAAVHPACGTHLTRTIRTGARCAYMVDPSVSPAWDVRWSV